VQRLSRWVVAAIAATLIAAAPAAAFENGHATRADLAPVFITGNTAYLAKGEAAASFNTMRSCAVRDGIDLYPQHSGYTPAATAYRNGNIQLDLWNLFVAGRGAVAARPIHTAGGWVFTSNHGLGRAVDLAQPNMATWVLRHGGPFGWSHIEGQRVGEWWHYIYVGGFHRPDPGTSLRFPNLKLGSGGLCQSFAVKEVQRRLGTTEDGEYGKTTRRAVKVFERAKGLPVDGRVTSKVWLELRKASRGEAKSTNARVVGKLPGAVAPMAGQDVKAVQGLLNKAFKAMGRLRRVQVTGVLDQQTIVAVRRFQKLRHLPVTGRVDDRTYAELLKVKPPEAQALVVTPQGAQLVASFEGCSRTPYQDAVHVWTIGFGHTGPDVFRLSPLSCAGPNGSAVVLLQKDLNRFALGVTRLVHVKLGLRQFNASCPGPSTWAWARWRARRCCVSSTPGTTARQPTSS
jgi:peptidoglycan hydrolase-like protein with peptidoglycan-binding domain